jgi:hypothetical protein
MPVRVGPTPAGKAPPVLGNQSVKRPLLDTKHADWTLYSDTWLNTSVMYDGSPAIDKCVSRFLTQRPREDIILFAHRCALFTYENHLRTGLGYYEAQMFREDPDIHLKMKDPKTGDPVVDSTLNPEQEAFYTLRFLKNCDRAGTPMVDKWQKVYQYGLLYGSAWLLTDLPSPSTAPNTLKDQQDQYLLDPYQVLYQPRDIINYEVDEQGNLEWAMVFTRIEKQEFLKPAMVTDRWSYYDRQTYSIYEQTYARESTDVQIKATQDDEPCLLVATGYHAMHASNQVPLQKVTFPTSWWLAKGAYSPARSLINVSNARQWSLLMSALAVPVVKTSREITQITNSETTFLQLDPGDEYSYTEPEGRAWAELLKEKISLKEDMYRSMYLVAMARDTNATAAAQSGVSKQQDMAPSHVVLSGMGAILRSSMQEALQRVALVRASLPGSEGDADLVPDVRGFDFDDSLSVEEIDVIQTLLGVEVPSDLFEKELFKSAARSFFKNSNPDGLTEIFKQIDAAPTKEQRDQAALQQKADLIRSNITARVKDPVLKEVSQ